MKYGIPLLLAISSCARYIQHDPNSYCLNREIEPRLRPVLSCKEISGEPMDCRYGLTLEFHWKCEKWSSY
jgi:hypothetical protein